jgi:hypothetical protein
MGWDKPGGVAVSLPDNGEPEDNRIEIVLVRPRAPQCDDDDDEPVVPRNGHGNGSSRLQ